MHSNSAPLSEIILGTWRWHISNRFGTIKFNLDDTYENLHNEFLPVNEGHENIWRIQNDNIIDIITKNGESETTIFQLEKISKNCHLIVFKGFSIGDYIFIKL